ncbi:Six-hairpin glycosidase-like protein [Tuber indicum]|nr:Six-hairpin glycosidase-like protein [Tuber indicum]
MPWLTLLSSLLLLLAAAVGESQDTPIFPGPWERYIQAPESRRVRPQKVYYTEGTVSAATDSSGVTVLKGQGALVTYEFAQNIAGRLFFEVDSATTSKHQSIGIAFSESPRFIGRRTDGTGDRVEYDLTHFQPLKSGLNSLGQEHVRGAFKYVTLFIPHPRDPKAGQALPHIASLTTKSIAADLSDLTQMDFGTRGGQQPLLPVESVGFKDVWVKYSAFPSHENPRRYTGYFYSNDNLLNRIWYAGAYTLQITTIPPKEGGTLIDLNKVVDHNRAPHGTWYSNFTISNGTSVTTDGAKRDRMVYAGDMTLAAPGIAVSTYDLVSVKNALDTLFEHYYHSSREEGGKGSGMIRLPYAGPPMGFRFEFSDTYHMHALLGVYQYVLYSGDFDYLKHLWWKYVQAIEYSTSKILKHTGLMYVTSGNDWLRPGMGRENIEAQGILLKTLFGSVKLAEWLDEDGYKFKDVKGRDLKQLITLWEGYMAGIKKGVMAPEKLWNGTVGLFCDNPEDRRDIFPQDGNSWAVATGLVTGGIAHRISRELKNRWGTYGAPAVELPNTISPFASGFELQAHTQIGNYQNALDLMRRQWGYMLDGPGFTNSTLVEGFRMDGDIQYPAYWSSTRNSHAHGWSAGPTSVLTDSILGIKLLSPLGKTWSITPQPGDLTHVEGGFQTSLGKFVVNYDKTAEEEVLEVETPEGSFGTLNWGGLVGGMKMEAGGKWRLTKSRDGRIRGGKVGTRLVHQDGPGQGRPQDAGTEEL